MVTTLRGTDPGSVSRLGGLLRTTADTLSGDLAALPATSPLAQLATATADQVDAIGSALQVHAQELAEAAAAYSRLQERAAALGLIVTDWTVTEPFGLIGSDVAARRGVERPQVQAQADRLASRLARGRAQLARQLAQASQQVARASAEAISEQLQAIVNVTRAVLAKTPPELSSDIIDRGMVLTWHAPAAIEVVFDMMTDEAFHSRVCEATHAMSYSATVSRQSDGATVITHREMPTNSFPDFARSMVGQSIDIGETIVYGPPGPHGTRIGEMSISMGSAPIHLKGDIRIIPADDGTEVIIEGNLKASIPFVGGKVESAAAPSVISGIHKEYGVGLAWLAERGHTDQD